MWFEELRNVRVKKLDPRYDGNDERDVIVYVRKQGRCDTQ